MRNRIQNALNNVTKEINDLEDTVRLMQAYSRYKAIAVAYETRKAFAAHAAIAFEANEVLFEFENRYGTRLSIIEAFEKMDTIPSANILDEEDFESFKTSTDLAFVKHLLHSGFGEYNLHAGGRLLSLECKNVNIEGKVVNSDGKDIDYTIQVLGLDPTVQLNALVMVDVQGYEIWRGRRVMFDVFNSTFVQNLLNLVTGDATCKLKEMRLTRNTEYLAYSKETSSQSLRFVVRDTNEGTPYLEYEVSGTVLKEGAEKHSSTRKSFSNITEAFHEMNKLASRV